MDTVTRLCAEVDCGFVVLQLYLHGGAWGSGFKFGASAARGEVTVEPPLRPLRLIRARHDDTKKKIMMRP